MAAFERAYVLSAAEDDCHLQSIGQRLKIHRMFSQSSFFESFISEMNDSIKGLFAAEKSMARFMIAWESNRTRGMHKHYSWFCEKLKLLDENVSIDSDANFLFIFYGRAIQEAFTKRKEENQRRTTFFWKPPYRESERGLFQVGRGKND